MLDPATVDVICCPETDLVEPVYVQSVVELFNLVDLESEGK
jgi:hypothetical protein